MLSLRHGSGSCLTARRAGGRLKLAVSEASPVPSTLGQVVFALIGALQLTACDVLVLATGRTRVATLPCGAPVYRITSTSLRTTAAPSRADRRYLALLRVALRDALLFAGRGGDVTRSAQRPAATTGDVWATVDGRFCWNAHLAEPVLAAGACAFCPPVVLGYASERAICRGADKLCVALVTRRHVGRLGRRLWCRGVDAEGNAAALVEVEQLVTLRPSGGGAASRVTSHLQLRGSVPVLWTEQPCLLPKPPLLLAPAADSAAPFAKHAASLRAAYGDGVALLSLLNARGREAPLAAAYAAAAEQLQQGQSSPWLSFLPFDFNAHGGVGEEGAAALLTLLGDHLGRADSDLFTTAIGVRQAGVLRTNCLDCLDRTNIVQTLLGVCEVLPRQLTVLGVRDGGAREAAAEALRALWREAGDNVSGYYAGTPAQRRRGAAAHGRLADAALHARDVAISIGRYFINNHADSARCDADALVSGAHAPRADAFSGGPAAVLRSFPLLQALVAFCTTAALLSADGSPLLLVMACIGLGRRHGASFVSRPALFVA